MIFDTSNNEGILKLENYLIENSFTSGFVPSTSDLDILKMLKIPVVGTDLPHIRRWMRNILSYSLEEQKQFVKTGEVKEEDEDDFDLFGEENEEEKKAKENLKKKTQEKKPTKVVIGKSSLVFDIKPVSLDTNLDDVERLVRNLVIEGLEWSKVSKRLPVAYGLMKLQIGATIIDDLVNTEDVTNMIECIGLNEQEAKRKIAIRDGELSEDEDEDEEDMCLVGSCEIVSFNKL